MDTKDLNRSCADIGFSLPSGNGAVVEVSENDGAPERERSAGSYGAGTERRAGGIERSKTARRQESIPPRRYIVRAGNHKFKF